jgi:hypothetical protein
MIVNNHDITHNISEVLEEKDLAFSYGEEEISENQEDNNDIEDELSLSEDNKTEVRYDI